MKPDQFDLFCRRGQASFEKASNGCDDGCISGNMVKTGNSAKSCDCVQYFISILPIQLAIDETSSSDISSRGTRTDIFYPGVEADMIPLPWKVFCPSNVRILVHIVSNEL